MSSSSITSNFPGLERWFGDIKQNWGWLLALGILMIAAGVVGFGAINSVSVVTTIFIGSLMLVAGIAQIIQAFAAKGWKSVTLLLVLGILYMVAGYLTLKDPETGTMSLTLVLGMTLIIAGAFRVYLAFQLKPMSIWGLVLFGAIISIILGVLILANWPSSSTYTIGTFVCVDLIVSGISYMALAISIKNA